jgi:outer membrane protein TolC
MALKKTAFLTIFAVLFALVPLDGQQAIKLPEAQQAKAQPAAQGKTLSLTLDYCIARALKSNLSLKVAEFSPQLSDVSLSSALSQYMPTMSFSYTPSRSTSASYSWLDTAGATSFTDSKTYRSSIGQLTPLGGTFSVNLNGSRTDTNRRAQTINPSYSANLGFSYSQPILRGFGTKMTNRNITIARNNLETSEISLYQTVQNTVYSVIQAYWSLFYSIESLKVQQLGLELSKDLLEKNKLSVEVGTMAPMDVLTAEADVASREAGILAAQASVKNNEDNLKVLINLSAEEEKGLEAIVPVDQPRFEEQQISLDQALTIAMTSRPDLKISKIGLETQNINFSYAKNQLLPDLSVSASISSPGISGTQLIYDSAGALYGNVIGTVPGYPSQAWKDAFNFKYQNWSVGVTLRINLSDYLTRAAYAQAKLSMDQALVSLKQEEQSVVLEIRNAVRTLETSYLQVQAFKKARELAEQKYQNEQEKLRVGQSTDYFVLQYLRDMQTARVSELNSIISYNVAIAGLDRSMGTLLEKRNIKIADILPEK